MGVVVGSSSDLDKKGLALGEGRPVSILAKNRTRIRAEGEEHPRGFVFRLADFGAVGTTLVTFLALRGYSNTRMIHVRELLKKTPPT